MRKQSDSFDFKSIEYPAFIVVYGPSKSGITTYNRSTYDERFACDVCVNSEDALRLMEGYPGRAADCKVYVVPNPQKVQKLYSNGPSTEYESESLPSSNLVVALKTIAEYQDNHDGGEFEDAFLAVEEIAKSAISKLEVE